MTEPRGRPRNFNEQEVVAAMVKVFWKHGYERTTVRMLEEATGVGIRGIANVFGDKDAIFLRVLKAYTEQVGALIADVFDPPSISALHAFFENLGMQADDDDPRNYGCLMVNTVLGINRMDAEPAKAVEDYRALWKLTFQRCLEVEQVPDADARAEFLVNLLWGALAQIRLAGSTSAARPMVKIASETIRGWH